MSRYDRYNPAALAILKEAQGIVRQQGRNICGIEDLVAGLLIADTPATRSFLESNELKLNPSWVDKVRSSRADAKNSPDSQTTPMGNGPASKIALDEKVRAVLDKAEELAGNNGPISSSHLIRAAWVEICERIQECLLKGENPPDPGTLVQPADLEDHEESATEEQVVSSPEKPLRVLLKLGQDLTARARPFPVIGRDDIIQDMLGILMKYFKPNPLLVGEAGVGKTAVVEGLASKIREGRVPSQLQGCRIFEVRISDLIAGTSVHGAFEARMRDLINELEANPDVILFMDEMHLLVQEGRSANPANILKPALSRGLFRCIGATTLAEYHRYIQKDPALSRRFQELRVDEPDAETTLQILKGIKPDMEKHHCLSISDDVLETAIRYGKEFLVNRRFPDKAIDILDRSCTRAAAENRDRVTPEDTWKTVARIIGIVDADDARILKNRLSSLEEGLGRHVLGQEKAVRAVANTVRLCKKRLDLRPERPDGVFLFTGPSGVGKTALAEALSEILTGSAEHCIRLDMSEYSENHALSRLIGSPAGYVGYGDSSPLVRGLQRSPAGVLLLDEFEKAHPDVHRLFLQVFDSGRLTDGAGETYSLSNMTIVATANIFEKPAEAFGFTKTPDRQSSLDAAQMKLVKRFFPVELINRFDEIVVFNFLDRNMAGEILRRRILSAVDENLKARTGMNLRLSASAEALVIDKGHSSDFGVRNLHRAFEELILKPLADYLERQDTGGEITAGQCLTADLGADGRLVFQK